FSHLRNSLFSMNAALMMCELIGMLVDEYDPHPGLYDKFVMFLDNLGHNISQNQKMALVIVFELGLLTEVGMAIPANNCCNCRNGLDGGGDIYFCAETGGFICRDCEGSFVDKFKAGRGFFRPLCMPTKVGAGGTASAGTPPTGGGVSRPPT
ncbi:MAG: DNA repair protein RecO, partial [Rhodocyclaceae bacterium]|nr:DNA repair protein RecO [Rhodocyclaceae bacterium]